MNMEQLVELELAGELKEFFEETEPMYRCGISPQLSTSCAECCNTEVLLCTVFLICVLKIPYNMESNMFV
jgi:hypothetical protein